MLDPDTVSAIALKTSLLVLAIGLVALLTPKQSAAWRHFLWSSALALSLLMPIAVVYLPSWVQVPLPRETAGPWSRGEPALATAASRHVDAKPEVSGPQPYELASAERHARAAWPALAIVWLAGALAVLLRNVLAHVGLMRWVRHSRPELSPAWAATLRSAAGEAQFRRPVRVLESGRATSPCTFGFARPVVLLPAAGAGWPEPQRRFALLHELAHIRRLDYLTTQASNLACALHWYNPLVWFAAAQARTLQEQACDDVVLNAGGMPSDYAQFLVSMAGGPRRDSWVFPAAIGMVQRSKLHGRVIAILDGSRARLSPGVFSLVALVPLGGLMLFLAGLSVAAAPAAIQPGVPLAASFSSVELRNGGTVNLVHGRSQSVTLLKGDPEQASITIRDDGRLVIDRCPKRCPRKHDFEVEVVTPAVSDIAVAAGGTIQGGGDFPPASGIGVAVSQGGTIDIRSIPVAHVTASVFSGGRIFTRPGTALSADVEQGGIITYWGDAAVKSSVRHGGVVARGSAADYAKPLAELGPGLLPPIPPIPPVSPVPRRES